MSNWTEERKAKAIEMYTERNPSADENAEVLKEIADELGEGTSPNGVRMILSVAGVYKKKEVTSSSKASEKSEKGEGTKRVSKDVQFAALRAAIEAKGASVDEDIISKLTGKAAAYFTTVLSK